MQLIADENFPLVSVRLLRQSGYDLTSVTEDSPGIEDTEVLARAVNEQRMILALRLNATIVQVKPLKCSANFSA
jgi:predicted nuclease of predicted toxin-antitoxin system